MNPYIPKGSDEAIDGCTDIFFLEHHVAELATNAAVVGLSFFNLSTCLLWLPSLCGIAPGIGVPDTIKLPENQSTSVLAVFVRIQTRAKPLVC